MEAQVFYKFSPSDPPNATRNSTRIPAGIQQDFMT